MNRQHSRRWFLQAASIGTGLVVGTRLAGTSLLGRAAAATPEPTSIVTIWLDGGLNAIFTGADAFSGTAFGVTANNVTAMGAVIVDNAVGNAIPAAIRGQVASVGIRHGISDHGNAQRSMFASAGKSAPLVLANAIGGNAAIKAAVVGGSTLPGGGNPAPVGGVSLQPVNDMKATIEAVAGAAPAANTVDREGAAKGMIAAQAMSKNATAKNATSLASVNQGLDSSIATLQKPVQPFNVQEFNTAYRLNGTAVNNFAAKMAAAELMVRSGTGYVAAIDGGWDSHGDAQGTSVRNMFTQRIATPLQTFLTRVVAGGAGDRNVIVALIGDFSRSLPGSDHQANLSALVIGKKFKNATTGKTDARVSLPAGTPSIDGFWSLLAAAAKVDTNPFGANPHTTLLA